MIKKAKARTAGKFKKFGRKNNAAEVKNQPKIKRIKLTVPPVFSQYVPKALFMVL
jgi:hypothetical protein